MKKQTIIVTGASSGIGKEVARYFLEKGDNVVINSSTHEKLEQVYNELGGGDNLAMVAGTDFGTHNRPLYRADNQVNFLNDAGHRTIADRLIEAGLDFKQYAEELPDGPCPWHLSGQHVGARREACRSSSIA